MPQSMMLEEKHTSSFVIQWVSYSIISFSKFYSEDSHKEYASHFPDRINLMTTKPWTFQCLQYICIYFLLLPENKKLPKMYKWALNITIK